MRGMNEEGRPTDGRPIMAGDRFRTRFGTPTTRYPHQRGERYASQWLIDNASDHAKASGDAMNAAIFRSESPNKAGYLPQASVLSMLLYLFSRDFEDQR